MSSPTNASEDSESIPAPDSLEATATLQALFGRWNRGFPLAWQAGNLKIYLQPFRGDLMLASETIAEPAFTVQEEVEVPESANWTRWAFPPDCTDFILQAALPPRPVLVRTRNPLIVPPHTAARFFILVPLWVQVVTAQGDQPPGPESQLTALPTQRLSDSWFGDQLGGDLCFSLKTRARRELGDEAIPANDAVASLTVSNQSTQPLPVEKLCLQTDPLALFSGTSGYWTSCATITHRDKDRPMELTVKAESPPEAGTTTLAAPARKPTTASLLQRSFSFASPWLR